MWREVEKQKRSRGLCVGSAGALELQVSGGRLGGERGGGYSDLSIVNG